MSGSPVRFNNTAQRFQRSGANGINFEADTFYCALVTSVPAATHSTLADLTGEVSGGNYVRKNLAKAASTPTVVNTNQAKCDFDDPVWTAFYAGAATPIVGLVIIKGTVAGTAGGDFVVGYCPLASDYTPPTSDAGAPNFTFNFDSSGAWVMGV